MADISPALVRASIPGLLSGVPMQGGVKQWIVDGNYSISFGSSALELELGAARASEILPYLSFDYERFALSSLESIAKSYNPVFDSKAIAWRLLNQYYAAFFGAHAVLRGLGTGVARLERAETGHLEKQVRAAYSQKFKMEAGTYSYSVDVSTEHNSKLTIKKLSAGAGGAHVEFWMYFSKFLSEFTDNILRDNWPDAIAIAGRIEELQRILRGPLATKGSWLSVVRNEINYQHKYGTWYPFKSALIHSYPGSNVLRQNSSSISLTYDPLRSPLQAFCAANNYLSLVNIDFAQLIKQRAGRGAAQFKTEWERLLARLKIRR